MATLTYNRMALNTTTNPRQTPVLIQLPVCKTSRGFSKSGVIPGGGVAAGTNNGVVVVDVDDDDATAAEVVFGTVGAPSSCILSLIESNTKCW